MHFQLYPLVFFLSFSVSPWDPQKISLCRPSLSNASWSSLSLCKSDAPSYEWRFRWRFSLSGVISFAIPFLLSLCSRFLSPSLSVRDSGQATLWLGCPLQSWFVVLSSLDLGVALTISFSFSFGGDRDYSRLGLQLICSISLSLFKNGSLSSISANPTVIRWRQHLFAFFLFWFVCMGLWLYI